MQDRPANVHVVGPIRWDAALTAVLGAKVGKRKKGKRLPCPKQMVADDARWPARTLRLNLAGQERTLQVKVIEKVCWYQAAKDTPLQIVLVCDPQGKWRDEALLGTDLSLSAAAVITGYCRRWSVEGAFADAQQLLGFHEPQWGAPRVCSGQRRGRGWSVRW